MTLTEFNPSGVTGQGAECDLFFRLHLTGPAGAHYELLREPNHTADDVKLAKKYLRRHHDVLSISVIPQTF